MVGFHPVDADEDQPALLSPNDNMSPRSLAAT